MSALAWSHLPASLYPEQQAPTPSALDEWARAHLGRPLRLLRHGLRRHAQRAARAQALEPMAQALDDAALRARLRVAARWSWEAREHTDEALALVREAARRSLGLRPHDCQLIGASCLFEGQMAEMQTGEGKTLTAALAAAVAACAGQPVHVITVNDYLAQRDAQEMRPLMALLGLSTGCILTGMAPAQRRAQYACDVAYTTGKELAFDYLKDRAAHGTGTGQLDLRLQRLLGRAPAAPLLRGLCFGIVDEADSILIDEARTPLILSEPAGEQAGIAPALLAQALALAGEMRAGEHYTLHRGRRELHLLPAGRLWLTQRCVTLGGEWNVRHVREHWALQALRACELFRRDEHYVVKDGKVLIVDEHTGRSLPGRTWELGLHQLVEQREGCALSPVSRTVARITYQRFFRRYLRLGGMSGTAREVRAELWRDYGLCTVAVPTHRPSLRRLWPAACTATEGQKWALIADSVQALLAAGRAVLVGTRSVAASQALSAVLARRGIAHRVLNALQDAHEAELIAQAGQPGCVTVATNMAGRGTDIKPAEGVLACGGLHVILSEFHESSRVDRQLFGRAARQGQPGSGQAIVSFEDPVFAQRGGALALLLRGLCGASPWFHSTGVQWLRCRAQHATERLHARVRQQAVKQDERLETSLAYSGRY